MKQTRSKIVLFFAILISGPVFSQVDFIADKTRGCDSLMVQFQLVNPTMESVFWKFGNGGASTSANPSPQNYSSPGNYNVSLTISASTEVNKKGYIKIHPTPKAIFTYQKTTNNALFKFTAQNEPADTIRYNYSWEIKTNAVILNGKSFTYQFDSVGTYQIYLTVTDSLFGCKKTSSQQIVIDQIPELASRLDIPNVFTPNGDNKNDFFFITTDGITEYQFRVYSRSGLLVYKSDTPAVVWDGKTPSGQEMCEGIYYYTLEPKVITKEAKSYKGFFYLFR